jgi:27-O-demethylrifamycin SV methyltransferase
MADSARLTPGLEVLDIGCGTGNPAIYLASQRGCRVTGISTSGVGIKRAKARSAKGGVGDRVMFHVADGTGTGYADNNFDCIWIMESSHLIPQKNLLVKEANRLLRAGGTLALCDFVLRRPIPPRPSLTLGHDLMVLEEVFGKTTLELLDSYVKQFEECGMNAEGRDISREVLPTFDRWRRNSERHASRVAEILGAKPVERFARSCDIMTRLFETGQLGYGIVSARKTIS